MSKEVGAGGRFYIFLDSAASIQMRWSIGFSSHWKVSLGFRSNKEVDNHCSRIAQSSFEFVT